MALRRGLYLFALAALLLLGNANGSASNGSGMWRMFRYLFETRRFLSITPSPWAPSAPWKWTRIGTGFCRGAKHKNDQGQYEVYCGDGAAYCSFHDCLDACEASWRCVGVEYWYNRAGRTGHCELHYRRIVTTTSDPKSTRVSACYAYESRNSPLPTALPTPSPTDPSAPDGWKTVGTGFCRDKDNRNRGFSKVCKRQNPCSFEECIGHCDDDPECLGIEYYHDRGEFTGTCETHENEPEMVKPKDGVGCYKYDYLRRLRKSDQSDTDENTD